jgi:hypothetical protein
VIKSKVSYLSPGGGSLGAGEKAEAQGVLRDLASRAWPQQWNYLQPRRPPVRLPRHLSLEPARPLRSPRYGAPPPARHAACLEADPSCCRCRCHCRCSWPSTSSRPTSSLRHLHPHVPSGTSSSRSLVHYRMHLKNPTRRAHRR